MVSASDDLEASFIALVLAAVAENVDQGVNIDQATLVVTTAEDASYEVEVDETITLECLDGIVTDNCVTLTELDTSVETEQVSNLETKTGIEE